MGKSCYRIEVMFKKPDLDARGRHVKDRVNSFLKLNVSGVVSKDVYVVVADINDRQIRDIVAAITNPVMQTGVVGVNDYDDWDWTISIGFQPGVTDNVATTLRAAIGDVIERPLADDDEVYSAIDYMISAPMLTSTEIDRIACGVLANSLIHSISTISKEAWRRDGPRIHRPRYEAEGESVVANIDFSANDTALQSISDQRNLALSMAELKAIQAHFKRENVREQRRAVGLAGDPTDAEVEVIAQTWSEHCRHKIFDAVIRYRDDAGADEEITSLYRTYIQRSTYEIREEKPWLLSVFNDNAGVIAFNDELDVVYKVETHNSPSALDPYGGAMTGIVGVNRDPMGTGKGAELLINVWGYCLASPYTTDAEVPEGLLHPNRIRDGVHQGVIEGGNQSGIPYALGWEYFDQRFIGKPLVFCGTVGTIPAELNGEPGHLKEIRPGDLVVMAGGRIGKDGIHGATFSSEALQQSSPVHAVQIGDPITQKKLSDFLIEARDRGLYRFITDNGAGGLSCSIGEMAVHCHGCLIDLGNAPLKYQGLQPWEILLSESQERMTLAVPPEDIAALQQLAQLREVEISVLGEFTATGKFHVRHGGRNVAYLDLAFLYEQCPRMRLSAHWTPPRHDEPEAAALMSDNELEDAILRIMARLNVCSNESKARQYDHEVKGISVIKPFIGVRQDVAADAAIVAIAPGSREGLVLSCGVLPRYSDIDTYDMTASVIDLAVRRAIAAGGSLDYMAALDNFCWPDPVPHPNNPDGAYKLAQLVRSNKALYDYTTAFKIPCISGKDSMKNDSFIGGVRISVPPTLLFSIIGKIKDIDKTMTLDAKNPGDRIYILGETFDELGGSEYYNMLGFIGNAAPKVDAGEATSLYAALSEAIAIGLCHSVHTPAVGGLAAGFARVAMGGRFGLDIDLAGAPAVKDLPANVLLFSETNTRFIVTVPARSGERFEELMTARKCACVGEVRDDAAVTIRRHGAILCRLGIPELLAAYQGTLP